MNLENVYVGDIVKSKTEKLDNGDIMIYGKAAGPDLDLDGDRCDPKWLKTAMPAWFEWGNIREQHSQIAAGVGVELTPEGDDWFIKARITDPLTAHKIDTGTLKGLSIGIKDGAREKREGQNWITRGLIAEVSVVDRPCNPTTTMSIAKSINGEWEPVEIAKDVTDGQIDEGPDIAGAENAIDTIIDLINKELQEVKVGADEDCDIHHLKKALKHMICFKKNEEASQDEMNGNMYEGDAIEMSAHAEIDKSFGTMSDDFKYVSASRRRKYAKSGVAMPNGDFPIPDEGHLRSAVGRLGNYNGNKSAAKRHIIKRAKSLGLTNLLPDDWGVGSKTNSKSIDTNEDVEDITKSLDVKAIVAEEISKAMAVVEARNGELEAELEEMKSRPIPGGPVLITPVKKDVSPELNKAAQYRRMAQMTDNPILAADYKALAEREERQANKE